MMTLFLLGSVGGFVLFFSERGDKGTGNSRLVGRRLNVLFFTGLLLPIIISGQDGEISMGNILLNDGVRLGRDRLLKND